MERRRPAARTAPARRLSVPAPPTWAITRPRLVEALEKGTCCPLTVVSGPPGSGKTLALSTWLATRAPDDDAVAWVSLDVDDATPVAFWARVSAALSGAGVPVGPRTAEIAEGPDGHGLEVLAEAIEGCARPVLLVLDEMEHVRSTEVADGLAYLLRHAASGLHLVVASRVEPMLPLARYRLAGELAEIRADDLAFTVREAGTLLAQHGVTLPHDVLRALSARTEGWAAGLRLAALSLVGHADPRAFVAAFAGDDTVVSAYLVDEVLDRQPADVRHLLLSTSVLDRVHEDLADALAGPGSGRLLPSLVQQHAFVVPLGEGWFRYHPLFAEALRARLQHEAPGLAPALHRRAARWYVRVGMTDAAARQWAASGRWADAARVVVDDLAVAELLALPAGGALGPVFSQMSAETSAARPETAVVGAATALAAGDLETCARLLAAVDLSSVEADAGAAATCWALVRLRAASALADEQDAAAILDSTAALVDALDPAVAAGRPLVRALLLLGHGATALAAGRTDAAAAALAAGLDVAAGADLHALRLDCLGHLSLTEMLRGRTGRAAALVAALPGEAPERDDVPVSVHVAMASVHLDATRGEQAARHLTWARAALRRRPRPVLDALCHLLSARAHETAGRYGRALDDLRQGREAFRADWLTRVLAVEEAHVRLAAGEPGAARDAVDRAAGGVLPDAAVVLARILVARGDTAGASDVLAPLTAHPGTLPPATRTPLLLVASHLALSTGDAGRGQALLGAALRVGESENQRRPFAVEAAWLRPALAQCPELVRRHGAFLGPLGMVAAPDLRLRTAAGREVAGGSPDGRVLRIPTQRTAASHAPATHVEALSPRERDTLAYLARMLTTEEIAAEMFLSVNTVKTHLKSIYRKLGVSSRRQAVRVGKTLELV